MPFAKIDGKRIHDYRFECQPSPCIYCFEFGLFYTQKMQSILRNKPRIFYSNNVFYLEVEESNERNLLKKFYPEIKGISLSNEPPANKNVPVFNGEVQKDELIRMFLENTHLSETKIIQRLGLSNDIYNVFSKIAKEYFRKIVGKDKSPGIPPKIAFFKSLRAPSNLLIDQTPVSLYHLKRKIDYANSAIGLDDKSILCVGDNDFVSLALSELYSPKEITVVDIDTSVIERIRETAELKGFPIHPINLDFRSYPRIEKKFDVFFTDPPFTKQGMRVFMHFGINHLKKGGRGYIAVPKTKFEKWTLQLFDTVTHYASQSGCSTVSWIPNIHIYEGNRGVPSGLLGIRKELNKNVPQEPITEEFYTYLARKLRDLHDS